ncbi:hypothetical protein CWATWH8502_1613 [Crocosphaera watsonii WH 8502]|uniref:Uncharacterized protein n=3 Tax=Crocosphaera watsonii TaxID=263511 RepID=T2J1P7_CROWT|nr:hypothetical protein CWATWH8502_1613 [Crocosphaera watsonii WH 8502]CCQ59104.1 hypothetical protein CWATWH0005_4245 [Crocosphaera watsonii WH 0005]CCQ62181.1 hypothetical protein CWATWH0401_4944 [Crocosphaera watsonii WH 0401]
MKGIDHSLFKKTFFNRLRTRFAIFVTRLLHFLAGIYDP